MTDVIDEKPRDVEEVLKSLDNKPNDELSSAIFWSVVVLMTLYCTVGNGLSYSYGHFLTAYAVKSSHGLSAVAGARLTSMYYAAQVIVRAINIVLIIKV